MNNIWHNISCSSSNNNQLLSSHLFLWATSHGNFYWKIKINNIYFFYRFFRTNFSHLYSEVPSYGCSIMPVQEISYELKFVFWVQGYFTWYKVSQFLRSCPKGRTFPVGMFLSLLNIGVFYQLSPLLWRVMSFLQSHSRRHSGLIGQPLGSDGTARCSLFI